MSDSRPVADEVMPEGTDRYRTLMDGAAESQRLVVVLWELTHRCNSRCVHCYVVKPEGADALRAARSELSLEECIRVLDDLAELGALHLGLTGGEILLRPDLFEIVREARRRRFAVRLKTNGTLITPEVADQIAKNYVTAVDISLYGATAATHDRVTTVGGSFERVVQAFRLLRERGVSTRAAMPVMAGNVTEVGAVRQLTEELGARLTHDPGISVMQDGCNRPQSLGLSDEAMVRYWRQQITKAPEPSDNGRHGGSICYAGRNRLCLGPCGEVYPCVELRMAAGNVREESLVEIWRESTVLQMLRGLTWKDFRSCLTCGLRDSCGPCIGQAWTEHGDLFRPSEAVCRQTRLRSEALRQFLSIVEGHSAPSHTEKRSGGE